MEGLFHRHQLLVYILGIIGLVIPLILLAPNSAHAAAAWPATGSVEIGHELSSGYEPSGLVWHNRLQKLVLVGDDGDVDLMDKDGTITHSWNPGGDLEAVAIVDHSDSTVLLGREAAGKISEFDLDTGSYTGLSWDVNAWVPAGSGSGLEAMTFIPNGYHDYGEIDFGGVVVAGWQNNGDMFVFDLSSSTPVLLDQYVSPSWLRDISGLHFERTTGLTMAVYAGYRLVRVYDGGDFVTDYSISGTDVEAITMVSNSTGAGSGEAEVFTGDDKSVEVWRYTGFPVEYTEAVEQFVASEETTVSTETSESTATSTETTTEQETTTTENADGSVTTTVTEITTVTTYETVTTTTTETPTTVTTYTDGSTETTVGSPTITTEVGEPVVVDVSVSEEVISEETSVVVVSTETVIETDVRTSDETTTSESSETVVTKTDNEDGTITVSVSEMVTTTTTTVTTTTTTEVPTTTTTYSDGSYTVELGEATVTVEEGEPVETISATGTLLGEHTFEAPSTDQPCNELQYRQDGWAYNLSSDCMRVIASNGRYVRIYDYEGNQLAQRKFYKKVPKKFDLAVTDLYEDEIDEVIIASIPPKRRRGRLAVAQLHADDTLNKTGHERVKVNRKRAPKIVGVDMGAHTVDVLFGALEKTFSISQSGLVDIQ